MSFFAYLSLIIAFICTAVGVLFALQYIHTNSTLEEKVSKLITRLEYASAALTICLVFASCVLLQALVMNDFSFAYVASYTDRTLPVFYRMTAFWAGQPGSLLFWALSISLMGIGFQATASYATLSPSTKAWYWLMYLSIMGFFLLLLLTWNNPFTVLTHIPADGNGLNPLLQNPGMIIHPPLLFLGYGGFVIPTCLALAQTMSQPNCVEQPWPTIARPFTMTAWSFLTAGIILGAWWAYMELGWGGYWAWDPVENASLIPWLVSTAAIHTSLIQTRRDKLHASSVFLMALTTISAFFATYLVRSGVVQSVHAFGTGGIAQPLLIFMFLALIVTFCISLCARRPDKELDSVYSREGFLVLAVWLLLALGLIILMATLWPVFTTFWRETILSLAPAPRQLDAAGHDHAGAIGLSADFYNRVCMPLFAVLVTMLAACPWLSWSGGMHAPRKFLLVLASFIASAMAVYSMGYRLPISVLATASATACIVSVGLMWADARVRKRLDSFAAHGVHLGVAFIALGIAFSGPYKIEADLALGRGDSGQVGKYTVTLSELYQGTGPGFTFIESELLVTKDDTTIGLLAPQRRVYKKWKDMQFAEAATIPSLGQEVYATLLGIDKKQNAIVRISVNPLVNWMWIGGLLMCLLPFVSLLRRREH